MEKSPKALACGGARSGRCESELLPQLWLKSLGPQGCAPGYPALQATPVSCLQYPGQFPPCPYSRLGDPFKVKSEHGPPPLRGPLGLPQPTWNKSSDVHETLPGLSSGPFCPASGLSSYSCQASQQASSPFSNLQGAHSTQWPLLWPRSQPGLSSCRQPWLPHASTYRSCLKCHLLREAFPDRLVSNSPPLRCPSPSPIRVHVPPSLTPSSTPHAFLPPDRFLSATLPWDALSRRAGRGESYSLMDLHSAWRVVGVQHTFAVPNGFYMFRYSLWETSTVLEGMAYWDQSPF